jgi:flagellar motor protein MotB
MSKSKKNKKPEEAAPGVPLYIITFSDMITLLLTFFVMLLSMAKDQDKGLFEQGQMSFKKALADFGLAGMMVSKSSGPQFKNPKPKYKVKEGQDEPEDRSIDSEMEMLRRRILELEKQMKIVPSQLTGRDKNITITDIKFSQSSWNLSHKDEQFLSQYIAGLSESMNNEELNIYIVGIANSEDGQKQKWRVSAMRANTVADYIKARVPSGNKWHVYCWGAGGGGDWTGKRGMTSRKTQVVITALSGL